MRLLGTLSYAGEDFLVCLQDTKTQETWYLLSKYHRDDRIAKLTGKPITHPVLESIYSLKGKHLDSGYIIEAMKRSKRSPKVQVFGKLNILRRLLDTVNFVKGYTFAKSDYLINTSDLIEGYTHTIVEARNSQVEYKSITRDRVSTELFISYRDIRLSLSNHKITGIDFDIPLTEADIATKKRVLASNVSSLAMKDLRDLLDLSWYEDENQNKIKDYKTIKTTKEFEEFVINAIIKEYLECKARGEEFILSIDTETTGLNICYLSDSNPIKSTVVSIPMSWKDNQAVVVFVDMESFDNVPMEYAFERLKVLVENHKGIKITKGNNILDLEAVETLEDVKADLLIPREDINLVGHNVIFDGKVFYANKVRPYWNNDTLQMAFNLNPRMGKGKNSNKLKALTRRLFGHETPELTDILGKGNEDKYKYIADEEVAMIYGCADADYTRLLFKELRRLTSDNLYNMYQKQDVPMLNILYVSEYYGLLMDETKVKELANCAEKDLNIIKDFLWKYVGNQLDFKNKALVLKVKHQQGLIDNETYEQERRKIRVDRESIYRFEMKPNEIRKVLYDILEYPIYAYTDAKRPVPKVDKYVMKKLMRAKRKSNYLPADVMSSDGSTVLIKAEDFNSYLYPIAYALSIYKTLEKEFTSYFKPIRDTNMEGRLFKGYGMARIETRRIMNPLQTMKGSLKELTLAFDGGEDYYLLDFDMAQVEYRIMVSIAHQEEMVQRLNDPEKDFHTESASALSDIPAHKITKKFRKQMKSVHFGIPYGLGDRSLSETMFQSVSETALYETRKLKDSFLTKNDKVKAFLDHARDEALKSRDLPIELKRFAGFTELDEDGNEIVAPVGWVKNLLGFYRLFDLSNLDKRKIGIIRRAAGNYPIQGFAAELFRIILIRFYNRCVKEGIADKIIWHLLIHDELLCSIHKSLNPFYIYKLIYEECMITFKGHTKYFVGINIGHNWKECKDDLSEAPVLFVEEMKRRWEAGEFTKDTWIDNAKEYVDHYKTIWMHKRIHEVLLDMQPTLDTEPIDIKHIEQDFVNYTVRGYLESFYIPKVYSTKTGIKRWYSKSDQARFKECLNNWAYEFYGEDKELKDYNGLIFKSSADTVDKYTSETVEDSDIDIDIDIDIFSEEEDEKLITQTYWSFDTNDIEEYSEMLFYEDCIDFDNEDDDFVYDTSVKDATNVADLVVISTDYEFIKIINKRLIFTVNKKQGVDKIQEFLSKYVVTESYEDKTNLVCFKLPKTITTRGSSIHSWKRVSDNIPKEDLERIDKFLIKVNSIEDKPSKTLTVTKSATYKHLKLINKKLIISIPRIKYIKSIMKLLNDWQDSEGYQVHFNTQEGLRRWKNISKKVSLEKLDKLIEDISK